MELFRLFFTALVTENRLPVTVLLLVVLERLVLFERDLAVVVLVDERKEPFVAGFLSVPIFDGGKCLDTNLARTVRCGS